MIILHNPLDKASRDFVASYGAGHEVLEYPDCVQRYPYISAFPSVVVAESIDSHYICRQPTTWQEVENYRLSIIDDVIVREKEQIKQRMTQFVQSILDSEAQKHNYDNIVSATSYAGYVNQFQAEGIAFGVWRSAVWAKCYEIMADVLDGKRQVPTEEQLLSELPKLML